MITIRHKQLHDRVETISITVWNGNKYDKDLWDVLKIENSVELYDKDDLGNWRFHNAMEKEHAIKMVTSNANAFKYKDIPDFDINDEVKQKTHKQIIHDVSGLPLISELNAHDISIINGERLNQLRTDGSLIITTDLRPAQMPNTTHTIPHIKKSHPGNSVTKKWTKRGLKYIILPIIGAVIAGLLILIFWESFKPLFLKLTHWLSSFN